MARRTSTRLLKDERGATAVEYALIISLVVLAMISALTATAGSTVTLWNGVSTKVQENNGRR